MVVVTVAGSRVERDVDRPSVVRERLEAFAGEVLAEAMNRPVQVRNGGLYLRGLIEDGARKSLEPLVSGWAGMLTISRCSSSWRIVRGIRRWSSRRSLSGSRRRLGWRRGCWMTPGFRRTARTRLVSSASTRARWGRSRNCQIGVSVHAVGKTGTVPLGWALYLPGGVVRGLRPAAQGEDPRRGSVQDEVRARRRAGRARRGWVVPRAPVLGDHDYGRRGRLRERLDQAGCEYVLSVGPEREGVRARHHLRDETTKRGAARKRPRPDRKPEPLGELIARLGQGSAQTVSFRDGPDGEPVTSTFIFTRVHVAHGGMRGARISAGPADPNGTQTQSCPHARNG